MILDQGITDGFALMEEIPIVVGWKDTRDGIMESLFDYTNFMEALTMS